MSYNALPVREPSRSRSRPPAIILARSGPPTMLPRVRRLKLVLCCLSIVANALTSGAIFTFPLLAPQLAKHLQLTQPQLSSIALAGMASQYPLAGPIGGLIDRAGPASSSLLAAVLLGGGLGMFANQIAHAPPYPDPATPVQYYVLVACFALLGIGAVCSYFASLVCASKNFPDFPGAAAGTSMALFGLSPLALSFIASSFFTGPDGLDVTQFTSFLAVLAAASHIIGAFALQILPPAQPPARSGLPPIEEEDSASERSSLLPKTPVEYLELPPGSDGSVWTLLKDVEFWAVGVTSLVILGVCEMVIANIGTIVLALPASSSAADVTIVTATQVRLISITNTASRLAFGFLADVTSPLANWLPDGTLVFNRKSTFSRVAYFALSGFILAGAITWMMFGASTQRGVWVLSVGAGLAYGTYFSMLPGFTSAIFGSRDFARNFGFLTLSAFFGTPIFTYIYAMASQAHTEPDATVCRGKLCYMSTLLICVTCVGAALLVIAFLWRRWQSRV
ncbi:MFS general substrate transporter [Auriculariales sp. MPI-PUGE-AT-0066]|nr:MFS general substrate transporter [Auriculariales sp. MPI-PUGE-AT-0066]